MNIFCKFPTANVSKLNFCMAKNLIWTTLKVIFSIFRFFLHSQIPDFQTVASQPNKIDTYDFFGFVVQGHIY